MMQGIFDFFNQGWVGSLIGLLGLLVGGVGIFSYKISKSTARPVYQRSCLKLIGEEDSNLPSEVKVYYRNRKVSRLTKNKVVFWNNGTEVLDRSAFVRGDPITISYSEGTNILSFKLLTVTRQVINFDVHRPADDTPSLLLDFDYLDPKDGAVIEILHDGEDRYPIIHGTLKGIPQGICDFGKIEESRTYVSSAISRALRNPKSFYIATMACGIALIAFGLFPEELITGRDISLGMPQPTAELSPRLLVGIGVIYASIPATYLWQRRKKYPKSLQVEVSNSDSTI